MTTKRRLPNRLTRRRWLASARGLIVITPALIREIIALASEEAPELAAKLQAWLGGDE